jgi:hypothetical protein
MKEADIFMNTAETWACLPDRDDILGTYGDESLWKGFGVILLREKDISYVRARKTFSGAEKKLQELYSAETWILK